MGRGRDAKLLQEREARRRHDSATTRFVQESDVQHAEGLETEATGETKRRSVTLKRNGFIQTFSLGQDI